MRWHCSLLEEMNRSVIISLLLCRGKACAAALFPRCTHLQDIIFTLPKSNKYILQLENKSQQNLLRPNKFECV